MATQIWLNIGLSNGCNWIFWNICVNPGGGGGGGGGALGQVSYGGVQLRGPKPLPYFRESRTPKTYPILGKYHNPGHPKRSGLQKHTLF